MTTFANPAHAAAIAALPTRYERLMYAKSLVGGDATIKYYEVGGSTPLRVVTHDDFVVAPPYLQLGIGAKLAESHIADSVATANTTTGKFDYIAAVCAGEVELWRDNVSADRKIVDGDPLDDSAFPVWIVDSGAPAGGPSGGALPASLYPSVESSGTVDIVLKPDSTGTKTISIGVPFPKGFVTDAASIRLETSGGSEIACDVTVLVHWREWGGSNSSIRSVLMTFSRAVTSGTNETLKVRWGATRTMTAGLGVTDPKVNYIAKRAPLASQHPQTDNYERATDTPGGGLTEPPVWWEFPQIWLDKCMLHTRVGPLSALSSFDATARVGFARTYVNDCRLLDNVTVDTSVVNYRWEHTDDYRTPAGVVTTTGGLTDWAENAEGYLYERALNLWQMYLQTGAIEWLAHAHRATQFASRWTAKVDGAMPRDVVGAPRKKGSLGIVPLPDTVNSQGNLKYSQPFGFLVGYMLTGDPDYLTDLANIADFSDPDKCWETPRLGPWGTSQKYTERVNTLAIAAPLAHYLATGNSTSKTTAETVIAGIMTDASTPPTGYPVSARPAALPFHTLTQHEGGDYDNCVYISVWMQSLLVEAMWVMYEAGHAQAEIAAYMRELGNYLTGPAIPHSKLYARTSPTNAFRCYPYLVGYIAEGAGAGGFAAWLQTGGRFSDTGGVGWPTTAPMDIQVELEHVPETIALLTKCRWFMAAAGDSTAALDAIVADLKVAKTEIVSYVERTAAGYPQFRNSPVRRFGWWSFGAFVAEVLAVLMGT